MSEVQVYYSILEEAIQDIVKKYEKKLKK